jgi:serine/threonine protein kinase
VAASFDETLLLLARGELTLDDARTQLQTLVHAAPTQTAHMIARVQGEVSAGRLSHDTGRTLSTVLEDAARTIAHGRPPQVVATLVRPAPCDDDPTHHRGIATAPTAQATAVVPDPDATIRTLHADPGTAARTLQTPPSNQPSPSAYAATLQAPAGPEGTQVMQNRLVRTLEQADEGYHGPLQPGSVIKKRFVLETLLGKGGMGLVFGAIDRRKEEARDPNPRVALKVLNADFQRHPQSLMALQREARKAQTLAHPNVVTVFDFDRDGDVVYMTMELLKGRSLDSMARAARGKGVGREVALPIIRGIAEGLAYAHRKGIVHSDLKPGNIFIAEDGTPKILDFGIARAVPSSVSDDARDVFDAGSLGAYTEAYATDEMVGGVDPHPADDMYALGIIAYELVTGVHPYQRHSAPNARKLAIKPAPLKGLKRREARAIESCLSFDRKSRPQDAGSFLKLFRGVTKLQQATLAATVVLASVAGYLWYQNYLETSPSIPFDQLPVDVQASFKENMREGDESWAFYEKEGVNDAVVSAIAEYSEAYNVHPRNRDAVAALNRAAKVALELTGDDPAARRELAKSLQQMNQHYLKYPPLVEAARE